MTRILLLVLGLLTVLFFVFLSEPEEDFVEEREADSMAAGVHSDPAPESPQVSEYPEVARMTSPQDGFDQETLSNDCVIERHEIPCIKKGDSLAEAVDEALRRIQAEDLLGAYQLGRLLWICERTPKNEEDLVYRAFTYFSMDKELAAAFPDSEFSILRQPYERSYQRDFSELGTYQETLASCAPVYALMQSGYRQRLERDAKAGNQAAQLMFMIWGPPRDASFEEALTYQMDAERFARKGLENREQIGLIGYMSGYFSGGFKSFQIIVAWAHARAAITCGVDKRLIYETFLDFEKMEWATSQVSQGMFAQEAFEQWADQLALSCPTSIG